MSAQGFLKRARAWFADRGVTIQAPLIHLTKAQIIQTGLELGVDYGPTHSCYDPDPQGRACGTCDACQLRLKGFAECGVSDPAPYQEGVRR